jgi:hypothetical protein
MVRIDETQEAIAYIRMAVDNDDKARALQSQAEVNDSTETPREPELHNPEQHWSFGSRSGGRLDTRELEKNLATTDHDYISFDERLRAFITTTFPEEAPRYEDLIYVCFLFSD